MLALLAWRTSILENSGVPNAENPETRINAKNQAESETVKALFFNRPQRFLGDVLFRSSRFELYLGRQISKALLDLYSGTDVARNAGALFVLLKTYDAGVSERFAPKRSDMPSCQSARKVVFDIVTIHRDFADLLFECCKMTLKVL